MLPPSLLELEVALRKESVDRNRFHVVDTTFDVSSLSARRVWIEMHGVQFNNAHVRCRSPQGECG